MKTKKRVMILKKRAKTKKTTKMNKLLKKRKNAKNFLKSTDALKNTVSKLITMKVCEESRSSL